MSCGLLKVLFQNFQSFHKEIVREHDLIWSNSKELACFVGHVKVFMSKVCCLITWYLFCSVHQQLTCQLLVWSADISSSCYVVQLMH